MGQYARSASSLAGCRGVVVVRVGGGHPHAVRQADPHRAFSSPFGKRSEATRLRYFVRALGLTKLTGLVFVAVHGRGHAASWMAKALETAISLGHRATTVEMVAGGVRLDVLTVGNTGVLPRVRRLSTFDKRLRHRNARIAKARSGYIR